MSTAVLNVKIDRAVKTKAHKIAEELGFSLSAIVNATLRDLIRNKTVSVSAREEVPNARLLKSIREAEEDRKYGRTHSFKNAKDAIAFLDTLKTKRS